MSVEKDGEVWLSREEAKQFAGISGKTLLQWERKGWVQAIRKGAKGILYSQKSIEERLNRRGIDPNAPPVLTKSEADVLAGIRDLCQGLTCLQMPWFEEYLPGEGVEAGKLTLIAGDSSLTPYLVAHILNSGETELFQVWCTTLEPSDVVMVRMSRFFADNGDKEYDLSTLKNESVMAKALSLYSAMDNAIYSQIVGEPSPNQISPNTKFITIIDSLENLAQTLSLSVDDLVPYLCRVGCRCIAFCTEGTAIRLEQDCPGALYRVEKSQNNTVEAIAYRNSLTDYKPFRINLLTGKVVAG